MISVKQIPEVYKVFETWVPDYSYRAALLVDLTQTEAYKRNKSFRLTVLAMMEHQQSVKKMKEKKDV